MRSASSGDRADSRWPSDSHPPVSLHTIHQSAPEAHAIMTVCIESVATTVRRPPLAVYTAAMTARAITSHHA